MLSIQFFTLVGSAVFAGVYYHYARKRNYPPGPKPLPLFGNLLDLPIYYAWKTFNSWHDLYGDVVHVRIFGQSIVVVGSMSAATEFFEKRSSIYSDRPRAPMINELHVWMGLAEWSFANMSYGDRWRKHRRVFHQHFNQSVIPNYHSVFMKESHKMAQRLLDNPKELTKIIRLAYAAMIMKITYGIQVDNLDDQYIAIADEATSAVAEAAVPGKYLVDVMPILKYIPMWFPGTTFRRQAAKWRVLNAMMRTKPFLTAQKNFDNGLAVPSVATTMINNLPDTDARNEETDVAMNATAVAYTGGTDTTVSATRSFILAMALYPEIQGRAQAEIDAIVGRNRLPDYADRDVLHYINAICKETMRWQPVTPLGGAHSCTADDEWNGYFIPKDAIVVGNTWSILHNPKDFPQPEEFIPERFLKDGKLDNTVRDPSTAAFGFGRRICPGRYFSDAALFSVVSTMLAAFTIVPGKDLSKDAINGRPFMSGGAISHPLEYDCVVLPRGTEGAALANGADM